MSHPNRKPNRLKEYDYSLPNAYFITICTAERRNLLWANVGASIARPCDVQLSAYGQIVNAAIRSIPTHYTSVSLDHYVIMPNHIHLLLQIQADPNLPTSPTPTISRVIQQTKGIVTKHIGHSIWQKLFHDHIIRNERDYARIWQYIDQNPMRWTQDCFYTE